MKRQDIGQIRLEIEMKEENSNAASQDKLTERQLRHFDQLR